MPQVRQPQARADADGAKLQEVALHEGSRARRPRSARTACACRRRASRRSDCRRARCRPGADRNPREETRWRVRCSARAAPTAPQFALSQKARADRRSIRAPRASRRSCSGPCGRRRPSGTSRREGQRDDRRSLGQGRGDEEAHQQLLLGQRASSAPRRTSTALSGIWSYCLPNAPRWLIVAWMPDV